MIPQHEELGAKVRRLQQAVADVHGETSVDGVTVRTDANGRLSELHIGHSAYARGPQELAELIVRVYRDTAAEVAARTSAIMAELRDDPAVARIADATVIETAPTPARPAPAPSTQPAPWQASQAPSQPSWSTTAPGDPSRDHGTSSTRSPDPAPFPGYQDYTTPTVPAAKAPERSYRPPYEDDDDDIDPYYQRKSWLV
ncbi:YbaB/EbfC family nucleoid-associated protein [Nocardia sp. SSK8]|uniref:YbaB/EbfC family nucleoid-associated protein n=1 Tax=Nocardia sp. SSK8 TaxID=3120154 RepID=UPI00300B0D45